MSSQNTGWDPAPDKTLEALEAELKETENDLKVQRILFDRHKKKPKGQAAGAPNFSKIIKENIDRCENKHAQLVADIHDKKEWLARPRKELSQNRQQQGQASTSNVRRSSSPRKGGNRVTQQQNISPSSYAPYHPSGGNFPPIQYDTRFGFSPPLERSAQNQPTAPLGHSTPQAPGDLAQSLLNTPYRTSTGHRWQPMRRPNPASTPHGAPSALNPFSGSSRPGLNVGTQFTPQDSTPRSLLSRKHQLDNRGAELGEPKSRKATPSPYQSNINTPSTEPLESDEDEKQNVEQESLLSRLLGPGASDDEREIEEEREAAEKQLAEDKKAKEDQERVDTEFALRLQQEAWSDGSAQPTPSSEFMSRTGSGDSSLFGSGPFSGTGNWGNESFDRRGSNGSTASLQPPNIRRRPSSRGMRPPPTKTGLDPDALLRNSQNLPSLTHHHAAGQPQPSDSVSFVFDDTRNQRSDLPITSTLPSRLSSEHQNSLFPPRVRRLHRSAESSPTPVIDLTEHSSDCDLREIGSPEFRAGAKMGNLEYPYGQPGQNRYIPSGQWQPWQAQHSREPQPGANMPASANSPDTTGGLPGPQNSLPFGSTSSPYNAPNNSGRWVSPQNPPPFGFNPSTYNAPNTSGTSFSPQNPPLLGSNPGGYNSPYTLQNPTQSGANTSASGYGPDPGSRMFEPQNSTSFGSNPSPLNVPDSSYLSANSAGAENVTRHPSAYNFNPPIPQNTNPSGFGGLQLSDPRGLFPPRSSSPGGTAWFHPNPYGTTGPMNPNPYGTGEIGPGSGYYSDQNQYPFQTMREVYGSSRPTTSSQQPSNSTASSLIRNTGTTLANAGSSLGSGAAGLFSSGYDMIANAFNGFNADTPPAYPNFDDFLPAPLYGSSSSNSIPNSPYDNHYATSPTTATYKGLGRSHAYQTPIADPSEDLKKLLDNIVPDNTTREGTPEAMVKNLYEHQKVGLAWMKSMEEGSNKGGILADDMGLGKTIQAIALMATNRSTDPNCKTTLIVCPVALISQWEKEIKTKVKRDPHHRLSVFIAHQEGRATPFEKLKNYDVVITTYGKVASEYKRLLTSKAQQGDNEEPTSGERDGDAVTAPKVNLPIIGSDSQWYRVILDEAQCVKNQKTKGSLGACEINSIYRWCMTGTPMQNSVEELYSLIKFLRIKPYCVWAKFKEHFGRPLSLKSGITVDKHDRAMRQFQVLLKAFMLRRTKKSEIDGKPILNLPDKVMEVAHCVFSEAEDEFYQALEGKIQLQFNKYQKAGGVMAHYTKALTLLLRLRQACCHPHLIRDFGVEMTAGVSNDELLKTASELPDDVVLRITSAEGFECPACMDAVENPVILFPCGHSTCVECFGMMTDPAARQTEDGTAARPLLCPICRASFEAKKITDLDSFNKVHRPQLIGSLKDEEKENSDSDSESEDEEDDGSLKDFIVDDDEVQYETDVEESVESKKDKAPGKRSLSSRKASKSKRSKLGKEPAKRKKPRVTLAELKKDSLKNADAKRRYLKRLRKNYEDSTKILKTVELLRAVAVRNALVDKQAGEKVEKTIIFSQFTSLLDLLEVPISGEGWGYRRYDGSMPSKARTAAVQDFEEDENCTIMLISLKAGNSGLNLTVASHVILFEPFWNPFIEDQAVDRAHRIGQDRNVMVHRLLVADTVENRIQVLQTMKRELIENALDESASQGVSRLTQNDLAYLFGIRG